MGWRITIGRSTLLLITGLIVQASCDMFTNAPRDTVYENGKQSKGYIHCEVNPDIESKMVFWVLKTDIFDSTIIYHSSSGWLIDNSEDKYFVDLDASNNGNFTLVINNLGQTDSGTYKCQLVGDAKSATITVADPPGIPVLSELTDLAENQRINVTCTSEGGYPIPQFTWIKDGVKLPRSPISDVTLNGKPGSRLEMQLTHRDHMANISCTATNILKSVTSSTLLNVQYAPLVEIVPKDPIVLRGSPFSLTCNVSSNPNWEQIQWYKDDQQVATTQQLNVESGVTGDSRYKCVASNTRGKSEVVASVVVHYGPEVTISQGDSHQVQEGKDVTLNCLVNAKPDPIIKWYRGSDEIGNGPTLIVTSISRNQGGGYKCVASNNPQPNGVQETMSAEASIIVEVQYAPGKPMMKSLENTVEFTTGTSIKLQCVLNTSDKGNPAETFTWYKSGKDNSVGQGRTLTINGATTADTGEYSCEASNVVGSQRSDSIQIYVYSAPVFDQIISRQTLNITEGNRNETLMCRYKGLPPPKITWYKDDVALVAGDLYTMKETHMEEEVSSYVIVTSILSFTGKSRTVVNADDFGLYKCKASNVVGESSDNYEKQVNVLFTPKFIGFGKVASDPGKKADIKCEVLSYPPAFRLELWRNDVLLPASGTEYNEKGEVSRQLVSHIIPSVSSEDYLSYTCIAENSLGITNSTVQLMKTSVPDPPKQLTYTNMTWESVMLKWLPGFNGGYGQQFRVAYQGGDSRHETSDSHITQLSPDVNYTFTVYATNRKGRSQSSNSIIVKTDPIHLPTSSVTYDANTGIASIVVNTSNKTYPFQYCVILQGSNNMKTYEDVTACLTDVQDIENSNYKHYRVLTCITHRLDICSKSQATSRQSASEEDDNRQKIIIAVVLSVFFVVLIVLILVIYIIVKKRKAHNQKRLPSSNGHINPIMSASGGVSTEIQLSKTSGYNINADLDIDDPDSLPAYSETPRGFKGTSPNQNLDYIYASVGKKSAEQNKLNGASYAVHTPDAPMNIRDPASLSDNTDSLEGEQPPSPYRSRDLSFLGDGILAPYNRFPSISESGYSTPESKHQKKVIYEAIV